MCHGIIGHKDDGRALTVGGHGGQRGIAGIGRDGQQIAGLAIQVEHLIVHIRQCDLGIHKALDSLPVAEHIQLEVFSDGQILVALTIDVQIHVRAVVNVVFKAINGGCRDIVVHVQIFAGNGDVLRSSPLIKAPIGHTGGILHPQEVVQVGRGHAEGGGQSAVAVVGRLHGIDKCIGIVVAEGAGHDGRAGGRGDLHVQSLWDGGADAQGAFVHGLRAGLGNGDGQIVLRLVADRLQSDLQGVALKENCGGVDRAVVVGAAEGGLAQSAVGRGLDILDSVVRADLPAAVGGIDLICTLEHEGAILCPDCHDDAAVEVAVFIIALDEVVAGQHGDSILELITVRLCGEVSQQIGSALHAILVGIDLQVGKLGSVQPLEFHIDLGEHGNLFAGVHNGIDLVVAVGQRHKITACSLVSDKGSRTVSICNRILNGSHCAGGRLQPAELHALERPCCGLQRSPVLIEIRAGCVEALNGHIHLLPFCDGSGRIDPSVIIGPGVSVLIEEEVHGVSVLYGSVRNESAVIAAGGRSRTVISAAFIDKEAEAVGRAERDRNPASAAHAQIGRSGLRRKVLAKNQFVCLDQYVQRRNALDAVGKTVALSQISGDLHGLNAMQISPRRL